MDGFFVAKFKVEKRKKGSAEKEEAGEAITSGGMDVDESGPAAFNDDEDKSLIDGQS
jgi:ribosomal RNA methyltransferase Nop2